ncbi:hypothetical protein [Roseateles sp. DAIF2]|uniref:S8 family serine peptidase n=1 Tax=Roseateles sp. DAIF2 TaxID=2714952 RepID=UPI00201DEA9B|nr:hypothetical protein [Roseateles sp. DAIF2]
MNFSSFSAGSSAHRILLQRGSHLMIAIATGLASWGVSAQTAEPEFAKGRLLVQARAGLSDIEMEKVAKGHGGKARRIGKSDLHVIELPGNASERAVQALLAKHPQLRFVELDRRVAPAMAVNDPMPAANGT